MKNNSLPFSHLSFSSAWFWAIPLFALTAMLIIGISGSNRPLFLFLNHAIYFKPEDIWINITLYGDAAMVMVVMLPLVKNHPEIIVKTFIAAIIGSLFLHGFKEFMPLPRPPMIFTPDLMHQLGNQFSQASFPSGHATAPFTLACMVIFLVDNNKIRTLVLIYASLIAISRIATGVHWPLDILGGMFLGWFAAYLSMRFFPVSGKNLYAQRIIVVLLLLAAYHLIFLHEYGDVEARFLEVLTPILCLVLSLKGLKGLYLAPLLSKFKK